MRFCVCYVLFVKAINYLIGRFNIFGLGWTRCCVWLRGCWVPTTEQLVD